MHRPAHSVGGKDQQRTVGNVGDGFDEDGTPPAQLFHDAFVVHDLVADIDGGAATGERLLDDGDGAIDAGAESPGFSQKDSHAGFYSSTTVSQWLS